MKWEFSNPDPETLQLLHKELGIHPILCKLLMDRGISDYNKAKDFFRPQLDELHDPFIMKGMEIAVKRIYEAVQNNEKILIYGDYDVDGTTSVALMILGLKVVYSQLDYYIPDRYEEGYGVSKAGIEYAKTHNCKLIVILDCGVKANKEIAFANSLKIDTIICDHHLPGSELPNAYAMLNPKQTDCPYPCKDLTGCGIGFKLLDGFFKRYFPDKNPVFDLIDLVTVSISCDIVPIIGENRIIAYYGLEKINSNPLPGIQAIFDTTDLDKKYNISDIVFVLGPRINSAGRLKHAHYAVNVLIADETDMEIDLMASELHASNKARKILDKEITGEALGMVALEAHFEQRKSIVVFQPGWHKGVIGIVASRLVDQHFKPSIVFSESKGKLTGSARSVRGFDIYNALTKCEDLLDNFGGHKYAAGLTLDKNKLEEFTQRFEEAVSNNIQTESLSHAISVDAEIRFKDIDDRFVRILKQFSPFGPGNKNPVFVIRDAKETGYAKIVGVDHIKCAFSNDESGSFPAIAFKQKEHLDILKEGFVDICFTLEENYWNGNVNLQLNIKDIKQSNQ